MLHELTRLRTTRFLTAAFVAGVVGMAGCKREPVPLDEKRAGTEDNGAASAGTELEGAVPLVTGSRAPKLSLPDWETSLSWSLESTLDPAGQPAAKAVLVAFMTSSCRPCIASLSKLAELEHANPELSVIAVTVDPTPEERTALLEVMRAAGVAAPLLVPDEATTKTWIGSAESVPRYFYVNRDGILTGQVQGFDPDIRAMMSHYLRVALMDRRIEPVPSGR